MRDNLELENIPEKNDTFLSEEENGNSLSNEPCYVCGKPSEYDCKCRERHYCSIDHRVEDYKTHEQECLANQEKQRQIELENLENLEKIKINTAKEEQKDQQENLLNNEDSIIENEDMKNENDMDIKIKLLTPPTQDKNKNNEFVNQKSTVSFAEILANSKESLDEMESNSNALPKSRKKSPGKNANNGNLENKKQSKNSNKNLLNVSDNNKNLSPSENESNNSLLNQELLQENEVRKRILLYIQNNEFEKALKYAAMLYEKSVNQKEYSPNQKSKYMEDSIIDSLMYIKCNILCGNSKDIEEILYNLAEKIKKNYKFDIDLLKSELIKNEGGSLDEENEENEMNEKNEKKSPMKKNPGKAFFDFKGFKLGVILYSIIGNLYNYLGDFQNCEKQYIKIAETVENIFGIMSIEATSLYYMLGNYYYEQSLFKKAQVCFLKSLHNIIQLISDESSLAANCHFNLGIIYKKLNQIKKAKSELETSLRIRINSIGKNSYPVSRSLEELGKISIELSEIKNAFQYLEQCYEIRKKIIKDPKDLDLTRISIMLIYLNRKIEGQLEEAIEHQMQKKETNKGLALALNNYINAASEEEKDELKSVEENELVYKAKETTNENRKQTPKKSDTKLVITEAAPEAKIIYSEENASENLNLYQKGPNLDFNLDFNLNNIFAFHREVAVQEDVVNSTLFLLSLSEEQMRILNHSQLSFEANDPLFISLDLQVTFTPYQRELLTQNSYLNIPRRVILHNPEEYIIIHHIKSISLETIKSINKNVNSFNITEENILTLLLYNSDFLKVLDESQIRILSNILDLGWPLDLFFSCIRMSQVKLFNEFVQSELQLLTKKEEFRIKNLNKAFIEKKSEEEKIDLYKTPHKELQSTLIKFIQTTLSVDDLNRIRFDLNENNFSIFTHQQFVTLARLKLSQKMIQNSNSYSIQLKMFDKFRGILIELVQAMDYNLCYHFTILNQFMLNVPKKINPNISRISNKGDIDNFNSKKNRINESTFSVRQELGNALKKLKKRTDSSNSRLEIKGEKFEKFEKSDKMENGLKKKENDSKIEIEIKPEAYIPNNVIAANDGVTSEENLLFGKMLENKELMKTLSNSLSPEELQKLSNSPWILSYVASKK